MKIFMLGIVFGLLIGWLITYRLCEGHRGDMASSKTTEATIPPNWTPSEADLARGNQGVGWVFGRMIGVANAPGSPNRRQSERVCRDTR